MNYKREIAARIKAAMAAYEERTGQKFSFEDFAKLCNNLLSKTRLSNYANEIRRPGPEEVELMARVLGCDACWMMCLKDTTTSKATNEEQEVLDIYRLIRPDLKATWLATGRQWKSVPTKNNVKTKV